VSHYFAIRRVGLSVSMPPGWGRYPIVATDFRKTLSPALLNMLQTPTNRQIIPKVASVCLFVLIILHSAATRPWHNTTVFPSASASAQMKTQRPQESDKTRSPEINSDTAKSHLPRSPRKLHSPPNAPKVASVG